MPSAELVHKLKLKGLDIIIHEPTLYMSSLHAEQIQKANQGDKTLQFLVQQVLEG